MSPRLDVSTFLRRYDAMDRALVAAGFPATSPWWRAEIEYFLRSGRRRWVVRAGRRAGKSSTLCRLAVCWALWGSWSVPPGDVAVVPFVSVDRDEASARLLTIRDILRALGVGFDPHGDEIELRDRRLLFRVVTCSVRGTVGFTSVAIFCDEMARWESRDTSANPAAEVMASLRPTMATQPLAFEVCSSSPWGTDDYHAVLFDAGETQHQVTSFAATWTANPTLTEERTRELEPSETTWSREYGAVPGSTVTADWFGVAIDRAITPLPDAPGIPLRRSTPVVFHTAGCLHEHAAQSAQGIAWSCDCTRPGDRDGSDPLVEGVRYLVAVDPAFASDRFGWAVASSQVGVWDTTAQKRDPRITRIHECGAWRPDRSPREMARRVLNDVCRKYRVASVWSDQYHGTSWQELARDVGLTVLIQNWSGGDQEGSKSDRYKKVRLAMLEGTLKIPNEPDLIREFKSVRGALLPSGGERIEVPRTSLGHGDTVAACILVCSKLLERSPDLAPSRETEWERRAREQNAHNLAMAIDFGGGTFF